MWGQTGGFVFGFIGSAIFSIDALTDLHQS
jgi:hypothetical protein